jgi:hypothetical protein
MSLSMSPRSGIASRAIGDALDAAILLAARDKDNPKRRNVDVAIAVVSLAALLDLICHEGLRARHRRSGHDGRDYADRSGLPRGIEASGGLARQASEGSAAA